MGVVVDNLLKTEDGRELFKHLFFISGYNQTSLFINPVSREVNTHGTVFNEGRRAVYLELRRLATRSLLTAVEEEAEKALDPQQQQQKEEKK